MCKLYYMIVNSAAKILLFFESCKRFWNFYRVWRKIFTEFGENRPKYPNMSIRQRTLYIVFFGIPSVRVRKKQSKQESE